MKSGNNIAGSFIKFNIDVEVQNVLDELFFWRAGWGVAYAGEESGREKKIFTP